MRVSLEQALEAWSTFLAVAALAAQAQNVIAHRSFGLLGGWSAANDDHHRMLTEKPPAFLAANLAAVLALVSRRRPDQVAQAWIAPISETVEKNHSRLAARDTAQPDTLLNDTA